MFRAGKLRNQISNVARLQRARMQQMGSWEVEKGNSIWKSIADWKSFSRHPNFPTVVS
jgi:hypothetical protein